jgi:hypothetical protein
VVAYFIMFIMMATFVMLSLFVGAVTIAMSDEMEKANVPCPQHTLLSQSHAVR